MKFELEAAKCNLEEAIKLKMERVVVNIFANTTSSVVCG